MSVQNTHWAVMPPVFFLDQALLSGFYESHVASAYWNRLLLTELKKGYGYCILNKINSEH